MTTDDRIEISYLSDHEGGLYRLAIGRRRYDSRVVPWWLRPWARLRLWWCRARHAGHHVMGLPTAGRKLWYPVHCHRCGCRHEWEREHGQDPPMGAAHVWKKAWLAHLAAQPGAEGRIAR